MLCHTMMRSDESRIEPDAHKIPERSRDHAGIQKFLQNLIVARQGICNLLYKPFPLLCKFIMMPVPASVTAELPVRPSVSHLASTFQTYQMTMFLFDISHTLVFEYGKYLDYVTFFK